jgi:hypothetical protein
MGRSNSPGALATTIEQNGAPAIERWERKAPHTGKNPQQDTTW